MTEEVVVRKEDSQKEQAKSILDYDEGFKPRYRNRVQTVSVPVEVPDEVADKTPADSVQQDPDDVVAQADKEPVRKAGELEEHKKAAEQTEENRNGAFRIAMQTDTWNQVLKILATLVSEARFRWTQNGLKVAAVDPSHVAMYEITVPREVLSENDIGEGTEFTIDIKGFPKLKNGGTFLMLRENSGTLRIVFNEVAQTVKELDYDSVFVPRVPVIDSKEYRATVEIEKIKSFLDAAKSVSDAFRITMSDFGEVMLSARSDSNEVEVRLAKETGLVDMHMSGSAKTVSSLYPLEYVQKLVKAAATVTEINVALRDDYPLDAGLKLPVTIRKDRGHYLPGMIPVRYLLAPRMEQ